MSSEFSPEVFSGSARSIVAEVEETVANICELTNAMARQADSINLTVSWVGNDSSHGREKRIGRENFIKALAKCSLFIDRFNKLLQYGDIDNNWKASIVECVAQGDYRSFSSYMYQLICYLSQCNESYPGFSKACTDAMKQFDSRISSDNYGSNRTITLMQSRQSQTTILILVGVGVLVGTGLNTLFDVHSTVHYWRNAILPAATIAFAYYLSQRNKSSDDDSEFLQQQMLILNQGYVSISNLAAKVNSSMSKVRDSVSAVASQGVHTGEGFNRKSFSIALDVLLNGIKRARDSVQDCYERLDREIIVTELSNTA